MKVELSKEDIEAIASLVAEKILKGTINKPVVYSINDVTKILGCHKNTVYNYIENKLLKATRKGKNFIITQENLNDFINNKENS